MWCREGCDSREVCGVGRGVMVWCREVCDSRWGVV